MNNPIRQTKTLFGLLTVVLAACMAVQATAADSIYARPDMELSRYDKIILRPLDLSDVKVLKPAWEQENPDKWSLPEGGTDVIEDMFQEIVADEISKDDGYEVVAEEGEGTLQLEVEFLSITPYAKPGTTGKKRDYVITTLGSGTVVLSAELRDSADGSLLYLVEGERGIGTEYKELSRENHIANLRETFSIWGQRVRARLDEAHGR